MQFKFNIIIDVKKQWPKNKMNNKIQIFLAAGKLN